MKRPLTFPIQVINQVEQDLIVFQENYSVKDYLIVSVTEQKLAHIQQSRIVTSYPVSTAYKGTGCQQGSEKTPLGIHRIAEKIGAGVPKGSLFKARKSTNKIVKPLIQEGEYSEIDAITSRILWLDGLEPNKNRGGDVDSYRRYIYIHGTNEEWRLGTPASHGCIRLSNQAIIHLYDTVCVNTLVVIIK